MPLKNQKKQKRSAIDYLKSLDQNKVEPISEKIKIIREREMSSLSNNIVETP